MLRELRAPFSLIAWDSSHSWEDNLFVNSYFEYSLHISATTSAVSLDLLLIEDRVHDWTCMESSLLSMLAMHTSCHEDCILAVEVLLNAKLGFDVFSLAYKKDHRVQ